MLSNLRSFFRKHLWLRKFIAYGLAPSGLFDSYFKNYKPSPYWEKRIADVLSCKDSEEIPRVGNAGMIISGKQVMHNGLKVNLGSYYGPEFAKLLMLSKGVHEPQEERLFMEVLKQMPQGAVMVELGAFWSFYSMWFNKEIKNAVNIMVEPDSFNIGQGQRNFKLNGMKGKFIETFIGKEYNETANVITIDKLVQDKQIDHIDILHSDIQGYEYDMLLGATDTMMGNKIGYFFISTHSNEVHYKCLDLLTAKKYFIIVSIDLDETFSEDGLIVARDNNLRGINIIPVHKKIKN